VNARVFPRWLTYLGLLFVLPSLWLALRLVQIVYVLEGTLRYTAGSDMRDLTPGQSMQTPRGTVHAFSNPFGSVARALIILSPDIGPQYFKDVAAVVNAGGPPDKGELVAVMTRYGLVPSAPK
jgi:Cupin domain